MRLTPPTRGATRGAPTNPGTKVRDSRTPGGGTEAGQELQFPDRSRSRGGRSWDQVGHVVTPTARDRVQGGPKLEHQAPCRGEEDSSTSVKSMRVLTPNPIRTRFETFVPSSISVHFQERRTTTGFPPEPGRRQQMPSSAATTTTRTCPNTICFGGRRTFGERDYYDMDDVEVDEASGSRSEEFDELLRRARKEIRLN